MPTPVPIIAASGYGCVKHPVGAILFEQSDSSLKGTSVTGHILAVQDYPRVDFHLFLQCLNNGLAIGELTFRVPSKGGNGRTRAAHLYCRRK